MFSKYSLDLVEALLFNKKNMRSLISANSNTLIFLQSYVSFNSKGYIAMEPIGISFVLSLNVCMYLLLTKSQGRKGTTKNNCVKRSNCETRCVTNNNTKLK